MECVRLFERKEQDFLSPVFSHRTPTWPSRQFRRRYFLSACMGVFLSAGRLFERREETSNDYISGSGFKSSNISDDFSKFTDGSEPSPNHYNF